MKSFSLTYTLEAKKRIRHLHPTIKPQIKKALEELKENPFLGKRLQRELSGLWTLVVRNHRVIYFIDEDKNRLEILTLGLRKTIYDEVTSQKR